MISQRFAIHPGWITSKSDGDRHFIGVPQLMALYELRTHEFVVWDDERSRGLRWTDFLHLYPRYHGDYEETITVLRAAL